MEELLKEKENEDVIVNEEENNDTSALKTESGVETGVSFEQTPQKKANPKIKKIIAIVAAVVVLISAIGIPMYLDATFFERLTSDFIHQYRHADNSRAMDGSYLKIDTNPDDVDRNTLNSYEYDLFYETHSDSLSAIQYVNKKLGFSDSVYDDMTSTTSLMGRQEAENKKFKVSWTYHPDKGLEVKYEKK